jgi:moderate conductance mechanosensitive channel
MPQLLQDGLGSYAPLVLPLIRIIWILILGYFTIKIVDSALKRLRLIVPPGDILGATRVEQRTETLRHITRSVLKVVIAVVLLLTVTRELGFDVGPVLASAGIVGLAIGFGAQSLVKDIISGFFILLEDQYGVGDAVKIGDHDGVVERMTLRVTVLRNFEGKVHVIPNGSIQTVTVHTKDWARAVIDVTVSYKEDLARVFELLTKIGNRIADEFPDRMLERPTLLGIEKMDDAGVTIRQIVKTPPTKQWDLMREWRRRIKEEFDRERIAMPQRGVVTLAGETLSDQEEPQRRRL